MLETKVDFRLHSKRFINFQKLQFVLTSPDQTMATAADPDRRATGGWAMHLAENLQEQKDEVLALQSIFEGEEDRLTVFSEGPEDISEDEDSADNSKYFTLQFQVPVKLGTDKVTVDVCMPVREPVHEGDQHAQHQKPGAVNFKRSDSGQNLLASIVLSHLTPLNLTVVLPAEYPSCGPPKFTMSCIWLSWQQLGTLCGMLDTLWEESSGMPILYNWIDWLENNSFSFLGLRDHVLLREMSPDDDVSDERAIPDCQDIEEAVTTMMRYNVEEEHFQFVRSEHECCVCFMELPGTEFYRMKQCSHHVCRECLKSLCQIHVREGTVMDLVCPESDCKTDIPPSVIKEVLGEEEFNRYERLALQKALDNMGDIIWCPRCAAVVIKESDKNLMLAFCIPCQFSFCTNCLRTWHQGQGCQNTEDEIKDLQEKMKQKQLDAEKIKLKLQRIQEERESCSYLTNKTQRCPSCDANIQKVSGCNKVLCRCGCSMCYICGKNITLEGYEHFNSNSRCTTFTDDFNDQVIRRVVIPRFDPVKVQKLNEIQQRVRENPNIKQTKCPNCKRNNIRGTDGNNHVRCWNCNTSFCFLCRQKFDRSPVTLHFKPPSPCKQHTQETSEEMPADKNLVSS